MVYGTANGIQVTNVDLADTQDVTPSYTDIVVVFQAGYEMADSVAQCWLDHANREGGV